MNYFIFRRSLLIFVNSIFLVITCMPSFASTQGVQSTSLQKKLLDLETASGGRIGIFAINTANNTRVQYRAEEIFPIQSTFKMMGVSAILKLSMTKKHLLQQKINYNEQDLVSWSPITKKHLLEGMTISELCAAAIMYSDNTATNLLVKKLGGPQAVTAFARSIDDNKFRLDNWEPELNSGPDDLHDTSTPAAMEKSLQKLALGKILAPSQREQLVMWMKKNTTGDTRIRAGVPKGWIVADKTGTGTEYGITNDIGLIWPPKCAPIVLSIYFIQNKKDATPRNDVIASATRILINEFARTDRRIKL